MPSEEIFERNDPLGDPGILLLSSVNIFCQYELAGLA